MAITCKKAIRPKQPYEQNRRTTQVSPQSFFPYPNIFHSYMYGCGSDFISLLSQQTLRSTLLNNALLFNSFPKPLFKIDLYSLTHQYLRDYDRLRS
jgi:hypothetical protein